MTEKKDKLTPKQQRFVSEYLKSRDAFDAAESSSVVFLDRSTTGYYVYFLIDPRNGEIFYVGKGVRDRLHSHFREHNSLSIRNAHKHARIQAVLDEGYLPVAKIFEDGLKEGDALELEKVLIQRLKNHGLTNISNGSEPPGNKIINNCKQLLALAGDQAEFLANLNEYGRRVTTKVFGSPENFHEWYVSSIKRLIKMVENEQGKSNNEK